MNANGIILNDKDEILLIRLKKGIFKNKLCIPGGGIHSGESSQEALKREIKEETGIVLDEKRINTFGFCELINKYKSSHRVVVLLHARSNETPKESDEGSAKWIPFTKIKGLENELVPFCIEALNAWKQNLNHFIIVTESKN